MTYTIKVHDDFVEDLKNIPKAVQGRLKKKLEKIIENPHIAKNRLRGDLHNCYKIKLLADGVRAVYQVNDNEICILLLTVGRRKDNEVYITAQERL